jgi:hypothetical protein
MTITSTGQQVATPTLRRTVRRSLFWVAAAIVLVLIALAGLALTGGGEAADRLSPISPAPSGAKAVVEVLRQEGVSVTVASSLTEVAAASSDPAHTTIVLHDPESLLDADQLAEVGNLATHVLLIDPAFAQLSALVPGVAAAGATAWDPDDADDSEGSDGSEGSEGSDTAGLATDCSLPAAVAAGTVTGGGAGYRVVDESIDAVRCLGSGDDVYSLIRVGVGGAGSLSEDESNGAGPSGVRTVLGASDALTNEKIIAAGNAALALTLLGENDNLIWYVPSLADLAGDTPPTLADLSPGWVIPSALLVILVALAAAVWRGRRFGPLVVENLPVVVRASETMEGRARLYEKGSARLRALDALRIGAVERLARQCGLPRSATVAEVITAVASVTGKPLSEVSAMLLDASPRNDADLVRLSDDLLTLERDTTRATRPD